MAPPESETAVAPAEEQAALAKTDKTELKPFNQLGFFDGSVFSLRYFDAALRRGAGDRPDRFIPAVINDVDSSIRADQSMGKVVVSLDMTHSDLLGLDEDDIMVELSSWQIKVSVQDGNKWKPLPYLTGDFSNDIRKEMSWWAIKPREEADGGGKILIFYLAKLENKVWKSMWFKGPLNPHRRGCFGWTKFHGGQSAKKADDAKLAEVKAGSMGQEDLHCCGVTPMDLVTGLDCVLDAPSYLLIAVHLDEEVLELATARVPVEGLFAADVSKRVLEIYMQGDRARICLAKLNGDVVPEQTTWALKEVRRRLPESTGLSHMTFYNQAIIIKLIKGYSSQGTWGGKAFSEVSTPDFCAPRVRASWHDRQMRSMVLSMASNVAAVPMHAKAKEKLAYEMVTDVESRQDGRSVTLSIHLSERLEAAAEACKVDLNSFFGMRSGNRIVEIFVFADAQYCMFMCVLGGNVKMDKATWTGKRTKSLDGKDRVTLEAELTKDEGHEDMWDEVFIRCQPWELNSIMAKKGMLIYEKVVSPHEEPGKALEDTTVEE